MLSCSSGSVMGSSNRSLASADSEGVRDLAMYSDVVFWVGGVVFRLYREP